MRDPQGRERQQRGGRERCRAVVEQAEPRAELAQLLPPFDFDHIRGQNARAQKQQAEDDEESDEGGSGAGAPAAPSNLIRHEPSVAPAASRGVADPARLRYSRPSLVLRFKLKVRVLAILIGVCVSIVAEPAAEPPQEIVENYCAASRG